MQPMTIPAENPPDDITETHIISTFKPETDKNSKQAKPRKQMLKTHGGLPYPPLKQEIIKSEKTLPYLARIK